MRRGVLIRSTQVDQVEFPGVQRWETLSSDLLDREIKKRKIEVEVPAAVKAQLIYEHDLNEKLPELKMKYPLFEESGMTNSEIAKKVKDHEDYSILTIKQMHEARLAQFIKDSENITALWNSNASNLKAVKRRLHLPNERLRRPEIAYPDSLFKFVLKSKHTRVKEKKGSVDMDEVPGKTSFDF